MQAYYRWDNKPFTRSIIVPNRLAVHSFRHLAADITSMKTTMFALTLLHALGRSSGDDERRIVVALCLSRLWFGRFSLCALGKYCNSKPYPCVGNMFPFEKHSLMQPYCEQSLALLHFCYWLKSSWVGSKACIVVVESNFIWVLSHIVPNGPQAMRVAATCISDLMLSYKDRRGFSNSVRIVATQASVLC